MKKFFLKNLYKQLLGRIYNPFLMMNIKPMPLVLKPEDKCLVIAPHPDDESIGCGGIMKLYPKNFDVICLTHGSSEDVRHDEMKQAMAFAGVKSYKMLNLQDKKIIDGQKEFDKIDFSKYDYIFAPYIFDQHKDHKAVSVLLLNRLKNGAAGFKPSAKIACYEVWSTINMPQYYVDISPVVEDKKTMINFHKSQIATKDYAEKIIGLNSYRGLLRNLDAVESFSVMGLEDFKKIVEKLIFDI